MFFLILPPLNCRLHGVSVAGIWRIRGLPLIDPRRRRAPGATEQPRAVERNLFTIPGSKSLGSIVPGTLVDIGRPIIFIIAETLN
ncbi:MAG: hypothetical protein U5R46_10440 [Gammaproteobacteria bacterium]|nr:hypothetical protein [Gammaproteobacteria bacterium]